MCRKMKTDPVAHVGAPTNRVSWTGTVIADGQSITMPLLWSAVPSADQRSR